MSIKNKRGNILYLLLSITQSTYYHIYWTTGLSDLSAKKTSSTKVLPVVSDPQILAHTPNSKPKVSRSNKGIDKTIKLVQR